MSELPNKATDDSDAEIRDAAINARLEALEAKVYLLTWVAGIALFMATFLIWPHRWAWWTLPVASLAAAATLGVLYGVIIDWKTSSPWRNGVVLLVFGIIWAACAAWLAH